MKRIIKKLLLLLDAADKKKLAIIFMMMIVGAVFETFGVTLIVPIVSLTVQDVDGQSTFIQFAGSFFGIYGKEQLVAAMLAGMVILIFLKNIYLLFEYNYIGRYTCEKKLALQIKLFHSYLYRQYEYYLNASTSEILRNIASDAGGAFEMVSDVLEMLIEIITSIFLMAAIYIASPDMAVAVTLIMLVILLAISRVLKPVMRKIGNKSLYAAQMSNKWLLQALDGIKDVKISGREVFFSEQYAAYGSIRAACEKKNNVLTKIPRLLIESACVMGILSFFGIITYSGISIDTMLPQLSAFAVAAVKLVPGVNKISVYLNDLSYKEPMLDKVLENIEEMNRYAPKKRLEAVQKKINIQNKIELKNVVYAYPGTDVNILDHVTAEFSIGDSIGVIGASGAGKSTFIDVLLGLLNIQEGEISIGLTDMYSCVREWQSRVGYIPQMIFMLDDSIEANVAFGVKKDEIDRNRVWEVIEEAQLTEFIKNQPEGLKTVIGEKGIRISGGQRQRIGIARALYHNPDILVFDEATSALDSDTEAAIMDAVNSFHGKKTMFIIAHRLQTIQNCDKVYVVKDGLLKSVGKSGLCGD